MKRIFTLSHFRLSFLPSCSTVASKSGSMALMKIIGCRKNGARLSIATAIAIIMLLKPIMDMRSSGLMADSSHLKEVSSMVISVMPVRGIFITVQRE